MGQITVEKNVGGVAGLCVITPTVHGEGAGDGVEHGGLARAVAADDGDEIPVMEGQIQTVQGFLGVDGLMLQGACSFLLAFSYVSSTAL